MKKKTYSFNVTYTIVISGTVEVRAGDELEAEELAEEAMPEVTWNTPDGFDSDDSIEVELINE